MFFLSLYKLCRACLAVVGLSVIAAFLLFSCSLGTQAPDTPDIITGPTTDVQISPSAKSTIQNLYSAIGKKEIPVCLFGEKKTITRVGLPEIKSSEPKRTSWAGGKCRSQEDFLGYGHNHPVSSICRPSKRDKIRFLLDINSEIEMVICEKEDGLKAGVWTK